MKIFRLLTLVIIILSVQQLFAQKRTVSGVIDQREAWKGTIVVEGDVTVAPGARLTIEAGTDIVFKPLSDNTRDGIDKTRSELIVQGILIVKGNIENRVTFTSAGKEPRMGDWYGIRLLNPKNISIIDYAIIEYAYNGISIKKSNPLIRNSRVQLNYNAGIKADVKSEAKILNNFISENGYAGVITTLGSKPILSKNYIALNQIGIIAFSMSQPNLGNLGNGEKQNSGENIIFENTDYDIYNHSNLPILAENNSWGVDGTINLRERIYDAEDEARYGAVDYLPFGNADFSDIVQFTQVEIPATNDTTESSLTDTLIAGRKTIAAETTETNEPLIALNTDNQKPENTTRQVDRKETLKQENEAAGRSATLPRDAIRANATVAPKQPAINYDQVFFEYFTDQKKAQIIKKAAPQISTPELGHGAKGRIIVRAIVGKNGHVESAAVIKGLNSYYDRISVEAAMKFRYEVGTIEGIPVRFYTNIFFEF